MTIVCPSRLLTPSAAKRAIRSFAPPGPKPTIQRMGRSGHSARADGTATAQISRQAAKITDRLIIAFSVDRERARVPSIPRINRKSFAAGNYFRRSANGIEHGSGWWAVYNSSTFCSAEPSRVQPGEAQAGGNDDRPDFCAFRVSDG